MNHAKDLTKGAITSHLIRFAVPLMLGNLFQLSYSTVDTVVISRFAGSAAMAAVGTCDQIMTLLILGVSGMCVGASVLMGHFFGAGDFDGLIKEMKTTVGMGLLFSMAVLLLGIPLTPLIFRAMNVQPEAFPDANAYMRLIFLGMPFAGLFNICSAALRSIGNSKAPVKYLIISCVTNMVLDLILVALFRLGVSGAALATVTAEALSAFLCIRYIYRKVPVLRFDWRQIAIDRNLARKTLAYGGLTALQQCSQSIGNVIIQGTVNTLGIYAAAAFSSVRKIEDIGLLPGRSISTAMTAFIAQNEGAGNTERTNSGYRRGMMLEMATGILVSLIVLLLRRPLMTLFSDESTVITLGVAYFNVIGFFYWLPCVTNGLQGYFRGKGHMIASFLATLTQISFRVLMTLILTPRLGIGGIGIACVIGWSIMLGWGAPLISRRIRHRP